MHVYIVFAHPGQDSFNTEVLEAFTRGLRDAGHTYEVGDLYRMNFKSEMDLEQNHREVGLDPDAPVPDDVGAEQDKIDGADALKRSLSVRPVIPWNTSNTSALQRV